MLLSSPWPEFWVADPAPRLCCPDAQGNGEGHAKKNGPGAPCCLPWKLDEGKKGGQCKDAGGVDHGSGELGATTVFTEGLFASGIHAGLDRTIRKGFLGSLACFDDGRHRAGAQDNGQQPRGKRPPAVEEDADKYGEAGNSQTDDRNMIQRQMQVGGCKECLHAESLTSGQLVHKSEARQCWTGRRSWGRYSIMSNGQGTPGNVIASLASFFIPGLGQLIQGRLLPAIFFFVFTGVLWFFLLGWIIHLWACFDAALWKPRD